MSLNPAAHPHVYGPRTGDRIRLGDTGLTIEVEAHSQPADDEFLLGFGKSGRDGIALRAVPTSESCDVVISNVLIIDPILGIRSASIGIRDGRIIAVGRAGNPDTNDDIDVIVGTSTIVINGEGIIATAGAIDTHVHMLSPRVMEAALSSGVTTIISQEFGPFWGVGVNATAPLRMARGTAVGFAQSQTGWIAARLKRLPHARPFTDGAEVPVFGVPHIVRHRPDRRGTVWLDGQEIHVAGRPEHLPRRLRDWLTGELRRHLVPLVQAKAAKVERPVKRITFRDNRSRWGSCGPNAQMSFSWRLVFAPPEVVDYLVAHEVAHLVHLNHGPRFWALAETLCEGSLKSAEAWLRRNGEVLLQYGV